MSQQSPQSPVASWAVRSYLEKHDDPEFLSEMYPTLVRNHHFWEKYSDTDSDGLAEYRWSGQVGDNSPLWDQYASFDPTTGCGYIPPVASVALNSFLFWDANHLAFLAEKQGLTEDVIRFHERAAQLQRDLFAVCYLPEEKRFWDYNHHTGLHRKVNTFYMFWPLFAGMDVSAETAKDLIENVLLDPEQFFGEIPFPSVAYKESTYNSKGYWRGRSWPHISYWLLQTLVFYGYIKEAKEAAARILVSYSRSAGFPENLASQAADFDASGFADYNWGCAAMYLIATEQYLKA
jgi:glycogen debranching enzyme